MLNSLVEADKEHLIHSVVSWGAHEHRGATILRNAKGVYVYDSEGREYLDGFSGLWCVNAGYGQQSVIDAATKQLARLPYATNYFHFSNEPAIELAQLLTDRAPGDLNHVFFTLGGSDAIDTAVRLIRYYFNIRGCPSKKHMITLDRAYHGSSSTGAGLTALSTFHTNFDVPLPTQHRIPTPYPYRLALADGEIIKGSVAALKAKVADLGPENVAAFFAEPVLGSGGVIVPPKGWLRAMRDACHELDILFVADEVITAFGRTGPLFACEHEDVVPDLMTLAKGLTSGYCPMGAVLLSKHIFRTIADITPVGHPVGHGFTYSAHPVSAAIALQVMHLYEAGGILENGKSVGVMFGANMARLAEHPLVGDVRLKGMLGALELVTSKRNKTRPAQSLALPEKISALALKNGLIVRAFSDSTIGLAPPLCCTSEEIELIHERLLKTLNDLLEIDEVRSAIFE